jgi:polyisoprenoid-binding protein YceI
LILTPPFELPHNLSMKTLIFLAYFLVSSVAHSSQVELLVKLSPAGSFKATTSSVVGTAKRTGDKVKASNIVVKLDTLKTGIALRDKHLKEHLDTKTYPDAVLQTAEGENGKGTATLKIRGQEKTVKGDFKIKDKTLVADFALLISDFGITGIKYLGVGVKDEIKVTVEVPVE